MAVTVKGSQTYQSGSGGYLLTHTMTDLDASGTDTCVIAAGFNRNPTSDVSGWTFEGNTPDDLYNNVNTNVVAVSTKGYLINNAATTIISTTSYKLQAMIGVALEGVDQTDYDVTTGTNTAGSYGTAATLAYTGTAGNMLLVFVSSQNDRTFTASGVTDITSVTHLDGNLGAGYAGYVTATGSSQTIGATLNSADNWRLVIVEVAAATGGSVSLTVANLQSSSTLDATALTQANMLTVADALSTGSFDNIALSQTYTLAVADLTSTSTLDNVTLTQSISLTVTDLLSSSTLDSGALTQANTLAVNDLTSSSTLDNIALTQNYSLTVADLLSSSTVDNPTLTQSITLTVADLTSSSAVDNTALTQANTIAIADLTSSSSLDGITVDAGITLTVADLTSNSNLDTTSLTQANTLTITDARSSSSIDAVLISISNYAPLTVGNTPTASTWIPKDVITTSTNTGNSPTGVTYTPNPIPMYIYTYLTTDDGKYITTDEGARIILSSSIDAGFVTLSAGNTPTSATFSAGDMV